MAKRNYQTEFHPEAIRETRGSIQWYHDRNEQAADELRSLVQSAESLNQSLLDSGAVKTRAELARYLGISRARVTQVLNRLKMSPD